MQIYNLRNLYFRMFTPTMEGFEDSVMLPPGLESHLLDFYHLWYSFQKKAWPARRSIYRQKCSMWCFRYRSATYSNHGRRPAKKLKWQRQYLLTAMLHSHVCFRPHGEIWCHVEYLGTLFPLSNFTGPHTFPSTLPCFKQKSKEKFLASHIDALSKQVKKLVLQESLASWIYCGDH